MTNPLDQISFQLGQLDAGVSVLRARAEKHDQHMEEVSQALNKLTSLIEPIVADHDFMKPQVRHYAGLRKNAVWVGTTIVTFGGFVGGMIGNWLLRKYW